MCPSISSKPGFSVINVKLKVKFRKWCNQGAPVIVLCCKINAGTYRVNWGNCFIISVPHVQVSAIVLHSYTKTLQWKYRHFDKIFHHWLHWKLSEWQLPLQPVMKISSKWHFCFSEAIFGCQFLFCTVVLKVKMQIKFIVVCMYMSYSNVGLCYFYVYRESVHQIILYT